MLLTVEAHEAEPGMLCLVVAGEIDMSNADQLRETITTAVLDPRLHTVHVDLGAVTFLDSHGLNAVVRSYNLAAEQRTGLRVLNARGAVRRVLQLTGVLALLSGQPDADPAW